MGPAWALVAQGDEPAKFHGDRERHHVGVCLLMGQGAEVMWRMGRS